MFVALQFVSVALLIAVTPATASSGPLAPSPSVKGYAAYYDGFYGPIRNGYWASTNEYYYSTGEGRPFIRDDGGHFRPVMVAGFHPIEGFGPERRADAGLSRR